MTNRQGSEYKVRKAVIPAAGFGTRLFPATKAVKKELFPLIDRNGRAKPIIQIIVEEALSAGIELVGIVVQPRDRAQFQSFFHEPPTGTYGEKLSAKYGDALQELHELGQHVVLLTQSEPAGFGHAVFCARDWVGSEPFLLLLGDHVYRSKIEQTCARQVVDLYEQFGKSVIGIEASAAQEIDHRGCVVGTWRQAQKILEVTQLVEKPSVAYAQQHLRVEGLKPDELLSIFGLYVLPPQIFGYLADQIERNERQQGEFQITTALDQLQRDWGMIGYQVQGQSFDTGLPESYWQAMMEFRQA